MDFRLGLWGRRWVRSLPEQEGRGPEWENREVFGKFEMLSFGKRSEMEHYIHRGRVVALEKR